jgi:hypothetical protein
MSKVEVQRFLQDVASNPSLRQAFDSNPSAAIGGYEITPDEMGALKSRDPVKLQKLGVDEQLSAALSGWAAPGVQREA